MGINFKNARSFFASQRIQKYLANASWLFIEKLLLLAASFFVSIYVARFLGPELYGELGYALSFAQLFAALAAVGLIKITIRELVNHPEEESLILGTSFVLRILGAIFILFTIGISSLIAHEDPMTNLYILVIASGTLFQSFDVIDYFFQAKIKSRNIAYSRLGSVLITSGLKLYFIYIQAPLLYFAAVFAIENLTYALGLLVNYRLQKGQITKWKFSQNMAWRLFRLSWPLMISGFMIDIYTKVDKIMIRHILDDLAEVGHYAIGHRLAEVMTLLPVIICAAIFPAIISAKKGGEKGYMERLQNLYNIVAWSSISISLFVSFFAEFIIRTLLSESYLAAVPVLQITAFTLIPISLGVANGYYLVSENLVKFDLFRTTVGAVLNIGLNWFLIPRWGIIGAAYATLIAHVISDIFLLYHKRTRSQFRLMFRAIFMLEIKKLLNPEKLFR